HRQVLLKSQIREGDDLLVGLAHALRSPGGGVRFIESCAPPADLSRTMPPVAGDHVQQRRLPGPIGTDEADRFTPWQLEAHSLHRMDSAEAHLAVTQNPYRAVHRMRGAAP